MIIISSIALALDRLLCRLIPYMGDSLSAATEKLRRKLEKHFPQPIWPNKPAPWAETRNTPAYLITERWLSNFAPHEIIEIWRNFILLRGEDPNKFFIKTFQGGSVVYKKACQEPPPKSGGTVHEASLDHSHDPNLKEKDAENPNL